MSEPIMFTIEIYPSDDTRFMEDDTALRNQIQAFTESLVKFNTQGPAPSVTVNKFNHKIPAVDLLDISDAVPTTWLDPILTGPKAVIGNQPYTCRDIEKVLLAVKKRIEEKTGATR